MKKSKSFHVVYFKPNTKNSSIEDRIYTTGKTYEGSTEIEALELFRKANKKAIFVGVYSLEAMDRIKG